MYKVGIYFFTTIRLLTRCAVPFTAYPASGKNGPIPVMYICAKGQDIEMQNQVQEMHKA